MTSPSSQPAPVAPVSAITAAPVSEVDLSCRFPLMVLFISAAKWLVIAWVFELIASLKFHAPGLLADSAWLTYGRVHPAFTNSLIYGFGIQAGLAASLWLLAQMGMVPLANRWLVTLGAFVWNIGVTLGIIGILAGDSTGFEYLEMPGYAAMLVLLGYLLIALGAVATFHERRDRRIFAAHWFLLTAIFWFPWIYSTANLLLVAFPVRGMTQAVIAWWYAQNLLVVWLALTGLGALFYLLPRLAGRELHSHYLAMFAYWVLILFAGWGGIPTAAPVPAWLPALSTVGTVLSSLAFVAVAVNLCKTIDCSWSGASKNFALSFFLFGAAAFVVSGLARAAAALIPSGPNLQLSWFTPALAQLTVYAFFGMVMFGSIYISMPRLLGIGLPWPKLVRVQLWLSVLGLALVLLPLAIGGIVEEARLDHSTQPFLEVMRGTLPFLRVSTMGDLLLLAGHICLFANLVGLVVGFYRARAMVTFAELTEDLFKPAGARP